MEIHWHLWLLVDRGLLSKQLPKFYLNLNGIIDIETWYIEIPMKYICSRHLCRAYIQSFVVGEGGVGVLICRLA